MPRRQRKTPDTRPDWRDPDMPVLRDYAMRDGSKKVIVDPDYERRYRAHMIETAPFENWRNDPTYELRKRR